MQSLLLFLIAAGIFQGYLYNSRKILELPHLARTGFALMSLTGPMVLLSTLSLLKERITWRGFLPFLVPAGIILYLAPFYASDAQTKLQYLHEDLRQIHFDCIVILHAAMINNLAWTGVAAFKLVRSKSARMPRFFSAVLLIVLLVPFVLSLIDENLLNSGLFTGVVSILVIVRSWQILLRAEKGRWFLFEVWPEKYRKSPIAPERAQAIAARITQALEASPYLDPDYSLADLSEETGEPAHVLSQVLNIYMQKPFPALIAELRVERAREMLRSPRYAEFSVLRIGFEAGFNSKSSFYDAFKKRTGCSPAEYRK